MTGFKGFRGQLEFLCRSPLLKDQIKIPSISNLLLVSKFPDHETKQFENDVKGSTASSSSTQNVAFISENTSSTNDVSTVYGVSNPSGQNLQYEHASSYSLLANQSSCPQLDHEDLEQLDKFDLEEMDLKWQVAHNFNGMKKRFYKKTGILSESIEPRESRYKRKDAWNSSNKDGRRSGKQEDSKALVTIDGEGVDWTSHSEEEEDFALMACNSSGSDTEKSANDKFGLGYGDHKYDGILSYENEVLQSVFMNKESELEKQPLYDRFVTAEGIHVVPPPMTENYMPSRPDIEVDYTQFTYGPKQTQPMSEPVVNESTVKCQPKVWSDAPIIEGYESDSQDEYVSIPTKEQETPSFANQQVKTPRETVNNQYTYSKNPKPNVDKKIWVGFAFSFSQALIPLLCTDKDKVSTDRPKVSTDKQIEGIDEQKKDTDDHSEEGSGTQVTQTATSTIFGDNSGCSRHMTRNKAYLAEFQDFNGGPVAF
ncbi:hypothetical protein Tco_0217609 [Tanacetum coccineum]